MRTGRVLLTALAVAVLIGVGGCGGDGGSGVVSPSGEWRMFGRTVERQSFNADETQINRDTVGRLVPRWRFLTGAIVTAAPVVADVDIAGEGRVRAVFIASWDRNFYALRASDGSLVWSYRFATDPGSDFVQGASAAVEDVGGRRRVFVASGETMHALDAATGELLWQFTAGTGCTSCDRETERNEILSPPVVYRDTVYFGMDVNEMDSGKGGFFAVDARSGDLRWYFDLQTGATCRPDTGDSVHRFDGFHSADSLGLPADFFATRSGCGFERQGDGCGSVYGGAAIDVERGLLYAASNNCDGAIGAPAPRFDEAIFALTLDGTPVWSWRPRELDPADLDFGSTPNLFRVEIGGARRDVVGIGAKDGTYYLLDRDGVNPLTGVVEPYWTRNVVPGGAAGGIIASSAVAGGGVFFSTAFGGDENGPSDYQRPAAWGLSAADGSVRWSDAAALASFSPTSAVPGVVFMGSFSGTLYARDADTGEVLAQLSAGSPLYSQAVVADGQLYVGAGSGTREDAPEDISYVVSLIPSPISAFCISGTDGCPESGVCIDANPCTADERDADGGCHNPSLADGTSCSVGALGGQCRGGTCDLPELDCDDHNQCTADARKADACTYQSRPAGTPCTVGDRQGACTGGVCLLD